LGGQATGVRCKYLEEKVVVVVVVVVVVGACFWNKNLR